MVKRTCITACNSESFTFILKSCVILAIRLALISASLWDSFTKTQQPIRYQDLFKGTNQIAGKWKTTFATFHKTSSVLDQQNICKDWKNLYVNKWNLQFQNRCNKAVIELCVMQFWSCLIMKFCKSFQRTQEKCQEEGTKSNCFFALLKCS